MVLNLRVKQHASSKVQKLQRRYLDGCRSSCTSSQLELSIVAGLSTPENPFAECDNRFRSGFRILNSRGEIAKSVVSNGEQEHCLTMELYTVVCQCDVCTRRGVHCYARLRTQRCFVGGWAKHAKGCGRDAHKRGAAPQAAAGGRPSLADCPPPAPTNVPWICQSPTFLSTLRVLLYHSTSSLALLHRQRVSPGFVRRRMFLNLPPKVDPAILPSAPILRHFCSVD
jgi:hypothetical protein